MIEKVIPLSGLVARILATPNPVEVMTKVVAIDGCGGAGKSTFAAHLGTSLGCSIVHTDDFASWENPHDWYPRVVSELLLPLSVGRSATFRRTDWIHRGPGELVTIPYTPLIILEGVSATRQAFDAFCYQRRPTHSIRSVAIVRCASDSRRRQSQTA